MVNLSLAKKLIDASINIGADAVKFQKRNLQSLYTKEALENPNTESQGFEILLAELKEIELSKEDYFDIVIIVKKKKLHFCVLHGILPSVDFLEELETSSIQNCIWRYDKFSSSKTCIQNRKTHDYIQQVCQRIEEIEKMVSFVKTLNTQFVLLHANSTYPSPIESLNVSLIPEYVKKFECTCRI